MVLFTRYILLDQLDHIGRVQRMKKEDSEIDYKGNGNK